MLELVLCTNIGKEATTVMTGKEENQEKYTRIEEKHKMDGGFSSLCGLLLRRAQTGQLSAREKIFVIRGVRDNPKTTA